ncbi:endonuclease VII domain-containing protein [Streptomyces sp. 796.1]|uniref:endonuclease VII domain-containing protein n=1 Tax=Streptomyces sp. 796.1 TaxID=3163029 RepID=UPI0039C9EE74
MQNVYGLEPGAYERLYTLQGGVCFICQRATGKTRRLSVDHDHRSDEVRGLLCRPCNSMLGHGRDDYRFFMRAVTYLVAPPARALTESDPHGSNTPPQS